MPGPCPPSSHASPACLGPGGGFHLGPALGILPFQRRDLLGPVCNLLPPVAHQAGSQRVCALQRMLRGFPAHGRLVRRVKQRGPVRCRGVVQALRLAVGLGSRHMLLPAAAGGGPGTCEERIGFFLGGSLLVRAPPAPSVCTVFPTMHPRRVVLRPGKDFTHPAFFSAAKSAGREANRPSTSSCTAAKSCSHARMRVADSPGPALSSSAQASLATSSSDTLAKQDRAGRGGAGRYEPCKAGRGRAGRGGAGWHEPCRTSVAMPLGRLPRTDTPVPPIATCWRARHAGSGPCRSQTSCKRVGASGACSREHRVFGAAFPPASKQCVNLTGSAGPRHLP